MGLDFVSVADNGFDVLNLCCADAIHDSFLSFFITPLRVVDDTIQSAIRH